MDIDISSYIKLFYFESIFHGKNTKFYDKIIYIDIDFEPLAKKFKILYMKDEVFLSI